MWGQRAFYERRERASLCLLLLTNFFTSSFLHAAPPQSHHLSPPRFSGVGKSLRQSRRVGRSGRNYPLAPFLGAASMFLPFCVSSSLPVAPPLGFTRLFSSRSSFLVGRVETTAFLSSPISSGATAAEPTTSAADDGEASFEIGGGR